jgi:hypothetical protein
MKRTPANSEPQVGIFWAEGKTIHAHTVPLSEGLDYGDCVNGPLDHVDYWPELERQHPQLRGREYFELPRGRVVYRRGERCFAVLMDASLHTPKVRAALKTRFQLPSRGCRFERDSHYTTDPDVLGRMFGLG